MPPSSSSISTSPSTAETAVPGSHVATFGLDYIIIPVVAAAVITVFSLILTLTVAITIVVIFVRSVTLMLAVYHLMGCPLRRRVTPCVYL